MKRVTRMSEKKAHHRRRSREGRRRRHRSAARRRARAPSRKTEAVAAVASSRPSRPRSVSLSAATKAPPKSSSSTSAGRSCGRSPPLRPRASIARIGAATRRSISPGSVHLVAPTNPRSPPPPPQRPVQLDRPAPWVPTRVATACHQLPDRNARHDGVDASSGSRLCKRAAIPNCSLRPRGGTHTSHLRPRRSTSPSRASSPSSKASSLPSAAVSSSPTAAIAGSSPAGRDS